MNGPPIPAPLAILTVVRNDLQGLLATRASLRRQTWRGFDWIVVDGASDDGTPAWLAAHAHELAWWRSAPDRGIYDAMNVALDAAWAEAVLFLNAGDTLAAPDTAERLTAALAAAPEAGIVYGDALERGADGALLLKRARSHRRAALGMFTHHQAMAYRRDAIGTMRYNTRYAVAADYDLTLRLLVGGTRVARFDRAVCVFAGQGLSQRAASLGRREQAAIRRKILGCTALQAGILQLLQWGAQSVRRCMPAVYAKWRFVPREDSLRNTPRASHFAN